jgi:hypothetical protein
MYYLTRAETFKYGFVSSRDFVFGSSPTIKIGKGNV